MQELKYIDTHSHIHFGEFSEDFSQMSDRMSDRGVGTIAIGTDIETSRQVVDIAREHDNIWACVGLHPNDHDEDFNVNAFKKLLGDDVENITKNKIVAIGECGLDYFRISDSNNEETKQEKLRQRANFIQQIELAVEYNLSLMLHIRSSIDDNGISTDDAHNEALEILKDYKNKYGSALHLHSHFTTFGIDLGKRFLELDVTFGIPGVVTYKSGKDLQSLVKYLPIESMVAETDAPYASPVPHRGKRNEPIFIIDTINAIADLREEDREEVRKQLLENSKRIFNLKL